VVLVASNTVIPDKLRAGNLHDHAAMVALCLEELYSCMEVVQPLSYLLARIGAVSSLNGVQR